MFRAFAVLVTVAGLAAGCDEDPAGVDGNDDETPESYDATLDTLNADGTRTLVFQPAPGANDGTDQGTLTAGKDAYVHTNTRWSVDDAAASPWLPHDRSTCNDWTGWSYYRFDVSNLPPADKVESASFQVWQLVMRGYGWAYQGAPSTAMRAYAVAGDWEENAISWASRPTHGDALAVVDVPTPAYGRDTGVDGIHVVHEDFVEVDITDLYRAWKTGTANHGLMYERVPAWCENGNVTYTASSDIDEGTYRDIIDLGPELRPRLVIVYRP
jgi:hypothetical protein